LRRPRKSESKQRGKGADEEGAKFHKDRAGVQTAVRRVHSKGNLRDSKYGAWESD
jgi:hypothetical protein